MKEGTVVLLPGGGARGSAQLGMMIEYSLRFGVPDAVIGTSVGALNGSLWSSDRLQDLIKFWLSLREPGDIYKKRFLSKLLFLFKSSIFTNKPLWKIIDKELDLTQLRNTNSEFFACAWNANTNKAELFAKNHVNIKKAVLASAAIPIIFDEQVIDEQYYFDGGVQEQIPTKFVFKKNINGENVIRIKPNRIVILHTSKKELPITHVKYDRMTKIAPRLIDGLTTEGKRDDIEVMLLKNQLTGYEHIETWQCEPVRSNMGFLDFYRDKIEQGISIGRHSFLHNTTRYSINNEFKGEIINWDHYSGQ